MLRDRKESREKKVKVVRKGTMGWTRNRAQLVLRDHQGSLVFREHAADREHKEMAVRVICLLAEVI